MSYGGPQTTSNVAFLKHTSSGIFLLPSLEILHVYYILSVYEITHHKNATARQNYLK